MRNLMFVLLASFSLGCASMIDMSVAACEAVIGGSEAGSVCEQIDRLRAGDQTAEKAAEESAE